MIYKHTQILEWNTFAHYYLMHYSEIMEKPGRLAITLRQGDGVQIDENIEVCYYEKKQGKSIVLSVAAPKDVRIERVPRMDKRQDSRIGNPTIESDS